MKSFGTDVAFGNLHAVSNIKYFLFTGCLKEIRSKVKKNIGEQNFTLT